jgi:hypothetical protein
MRLFNQGEKIGQMSGDWRRRRAAPAPADGFKNKANAKIAMKANYGGYARREDATRNLASFEAPLRWELSQRQ